MVLGGAATQASMYYKSTVVCRWLCEVGVKRGVGVTDRYFIACFVAKKKSCQVACMEMFILLYSYNKQCSI